jgi:putative redox protein
MQKVTIKWVDGLRFIVNDENKHSFVLDTKAEAGGSEMGFQPIDMLLIGLGGCMAFDIVSILQKKRSDLKDFTVTVNGERFTEHPKRYTKILITIKTNKEVNQTDVERALELSRDKYCSVYATLQHTPEIKFELASE